MTNFPDKKEALEFSGSIWQERKEHWKNVEWLEISGETLNAKRNKKK